MKFTEDRIQKDRQHLKELIKDDVRFALTFDECTSIRSRRYLSLGLHYNQSNIINLGLYRVTGSANSENLLGLVKTALKGFDLDFDSSIVCMMTDGCGTMTKIGKLAG